MALNISKHLIEHAILKIATKKYVDDNGRDSMSAGSIIPYGGATAPTSWLLCDGASLLRVDYAVLFGVIGTTFGSVDGTHFNVPDMRGAFPRGVGSSTQFTQDHTTVLGAVEDDSLQGHILAAGVTSSAIGTGAANGTAITYAGASQSLSNHLGNMVLASDGTHGTPRTSYETRPNNLGLTYIIKYTAANDTAQSIWGTAGTNALLNDTALSLYIKNNVGIGTATPLSKLHVEGNVRIGENNLVGSSQTIADDAVYSFTPGATIGIVEISPRAISYADCWGKAAYRATSTVFTTKMYGSAVVDVSTGVLTGTTGVNGHVTISAHTDGKIYIENRRGTAISIGILLSSL